MKKGRTYRFPFAGFVTHPSGRAHTHGADDGRVGWRVHLVGVGGVTTLAELDARPALCGLIPRIGWGGDAFVDTYCERCEDRAELLRVHELVNEPRIQLIESFIGDGWGGYMAYMGWCNVNRKERLDDHEVCCGTVTQV